MSKVFRIGTRGSRMALIQAQMVERLLQEAVPGLVCEIVIIKTSGDWKPGEGENRLSTAQGGKGLFAKEIEAALLEGQIDVGVHSVKDMPSFLPEGLVMEHYLERSDCRDAFVSFEYDSFDALPTGAVVGTSSIRRQAFLLLKRPDLTIVPFRGNVPTRIEKLKNGQVDATLLSFAGMQRIDVEEFATQIFSPHELVPSCGQGTIGMEYREGDNETRQLLDLIHHYETGLISSAERAALQVLDGSCHAPIGVYGKLDGEMLSLHLIVARPDGTEFWNGRESGPCRDVAAAVEMGRSLATRVKAEADPAVLAYLAN
ncbi:MAG: hydroxymethylbilane synthase [Pseudobdellovibrionaceae bacterium]